MDKTNPARRSARISAANGRPFVWSSPSGEWLPTIDEAQACYDAASMEWDARISDPFADRLVAIRAFVAAADVDAVFAS